MKKHEAIEIGVVRVEVPDLMEGVVVFDERAYLHGIGKTIFYNGSKRVTGCSLRKGKLVISIYHALWANEDYMKGYAGKQVGQLYPYLSR
jgi:hypothetical protein